MIDRLYVAIAHYHTLTLTHTRTHTHTLILFALLISTFFCVQPFLYIECDDCGHCIDLDRSGAAVPEPVQKAQSQILEYVKSFLA
mmetsp:Transcript_35073/g.90975  ORF Transcript_35073/g.90975 Transcript_35073/m.90975 type:complete len:85 (+) Transcript_35073:1464-1718(+)